MKESWPLALIPPAIATPLTIQGSAALSVTNLSSPSLVAMHVAALDLDRAIFALFDTNLSRPVPGLAAVHLAVDQAIFALSVTNLSSPGFAAVHLVVVDQLSATMVAEHLAVVYLAAVYLAAVYQLSSTIALVRLAAVDQNYSTIAAAYLTAVDQIHSTIVVVHDSARARSVPISQVEVKESWPLASIPLAIAALLMIPGYPVGGGGCRCRCAVPGSATRYLLSLGLTGVYCAARARSVAVSPPHPMGPTVSAMQLSHSLLHSH